MERFSAATLARTHSSGALRITTDEEYRPSLEAAAISGEMRLGRPRETPPSFAWMQLMAAVKPAVENTGTSRCSTSLERQWSVKP